MRNAAVFLLFTIWLPCLSGCLNASRGARSGAPTQADRLMGAYDDLKGGRFALVADFEDAKQMELVQLMSVSHAAGTAWNPKLGRPTTGTGCLRFTSASPADTVVINNQYAKSWFLKRDWREYDLLLLSVHAGSPGLAVVVTLLGGSRSDRYVTDTSVPLEPGWNLVRLDLAPVGERIPLDDVKEIRLAVAGASQPSELLFDDLVLTQSREDLLGDAGRRHDGLYVQRIGRRWRIGAKTARNDFEITFANGQIVEWYNMATDPFRLHNAVRGTALGPIPFAASESGNEEAALAVHSRIVELSPVRVVVVSEWARPSGGGHPEGTGAAPSAPSRRWAYTIYPTGQIYTAVEDARLASGPGEVRGLAVGLGSLPGKEPQVACQSGPSVGGSAADAPPYALILAPEPKLSLLYTVLGPGVSMRAVDPSSPASSVLRSFAAAAFAERQAATGMAARWASHLLLASFDVTEKDAAARAGAYQLPAAPRVELGRLVDSDDERGIRHGFDPMEGCFVVEPEQGRVRLVIGEGNPMLFSPAFRVAADADQEAWVYVDHMIHRPVARDFRGHLVFQLPDLIRKPTLVEVLLKSQSGR